jgi:hypothetical protein
MCQLGSKISVAPELFVRSNMHMAILEKLKSQKISSGHALRGKYDYFLNLPFDWSFTRSYRILPSSFGSMSRRSGT